MSTPDILPVPITDEYEVLSRLSTVRNALAPDLNDQELHLFALVAARAGLDPFAKQLYAVKRNGRVTFQTGIDGYRSTAARTGDYDGSDEPEFGPLIDKPYPHPEWARVTVYRLRADGSRRPQPATAWWDEFYPGAGQDHMWRKMPRNQLAKCAEALALRKAFPYVLADLYITEEMEQAGDSENVALVEAAAQPVAKDRVAARRAALEAPAGVFDNTADPIIVEPIAVTLAVIEPAGTGPIAPVIEVVEPVEAPSEPLPFSPPDPAPVASPQPPQDQAGGSEPPTVVVPPTPAPVAQPAAPIDANQCAWRLAPKKGDPVNCDMKAGHAGDHSWTEQAITSGGRVLPPPPQG